MWMTFLWLSLDLEFGKPNDGLCYVALSLVSLRLVLSLIWVFGIEFDMLEFSILSLRWNLVLSLICLKLVLSVVSLVVLSTMAFHKLQGPLLFLPYSTQNT